MFKLSYDKWNSALYEYFFGTESHGKIVYLYVNDQTIALVGRRLGIPEVDCMDSFIDAVRTYIPTLEELFERAHTRGYRWYAQGQQGPPPFVGLLALTVLAATRMGADEDEGIGGGNYYIRLRQLLGLDGYGKPKGFEFTEMLWKYLSDWQRANQGKYGYTTAFPYGNKYIGYPKSQCLVRDSERLQLYEFFHWCGYHPGDAVALNTVQDHLDLYLSSRSNRLSKLFFQNKNGLREAITKTVYNEFLEWDGTSGSKRSKASRAARPVYPVQILLQLSGFMSLVPAATYLSMIDEDELVTSESQVVVTVPEFDYKNHALSRIVTQLDDLTMDQIWLCKNTGIQLNFHGSSLFVFRKATEFGLPGWLSRNEIVPGQEHIFLYTHTLERKIQTFIQETGCKPLQIKISGLPKNWILTVLRMSEELSATSVDLGLRISDEPVKIAFDGGLRVGNQEWLLDAPPRILISAPYQSVVEINDVTFMSILDGPIQMDVFGIYSLDAPGIYKIRVGQVERSILLRNDYSVAVDDSNRLAGPYHHDEVNNFKSPFYLESTGHIFVQSTHEPVRKVVPSFIDAPAFHVDRRAFDLGINFLTIRSTTTRPIDLFVEYLSIRQSGNWNAFVKGLRWCFGDEDLGLIAYRVRRHLSQLGIVEFKRDGDTNRYDWWVPPTSVAAIPSTDNLVALTGARTRSSILYWIQRSEEVQFLLSEPTSIYEPINVYLLAQTVDILEKYLNSLNIKFNWGQDYFAFDLLRCVPPLEEMVYSCPRVDQAPQNWQQRCWDSHKHRWVDTRGLKLTQYSNGFGTTVFLLHLNKEYVQVDRDIGKLFVASQNRVRVFFYSNYCFKVLKQYALPEFYARVLASCSGEVPEESGPYHVYKNIPLEIALPVAFKLGFELQYLSPDVPKRRRV